MATEDDLLSTPTSYATPTQLASTREYAKALLGIGKNDMNQPVGHWTQGLANMVRSLIGGNALYNASQDEHRSLDSSAARRPQLEAPATAAPTGFNADETSGAPTPRAFNVVPTPAPDAVPPAPDMPAQPIANPPMPIPRPDSAPQTFDQRFPDLPPNYTMPGADKPVAGPAMSFDGVPQPGAPGMSPDAPAAIANALAPRGGVPKLPFGAPTGAPTGNYVDPRTLPKRAHISDSDLNYLLANPYTDPKVKEWALQTYQQQYQPMEAATTGGKVVVDPLSGAQRFIPDVKYTTSKVGTIEEQNPSYVKTGPNGEVINQRIPNAGAPQAAPVAPAAPTDGPLIPNIKRKAPANATPFAEEEGSIDKTGLPPEITDGQSKPPVAGPQAGAPPTGMLAFAPPGMDNAPQPDAGSPKGVQTAQVDPEMAAKYQWLQNQELNKAQREHFNQKDIDSMDKTYDGVVNAGQVAQQTLPSLELAKNIIEDPRFYSGIGGRNIALPYKQLQSLFGKDPEMASRMETFDKIISGQVIQDLRTQLQGTGQVRNMEIDLLSKAAANLDRTLPANRAVLELMTRTHQQISDLANVAMDYRKGYRFDKDGNATMTNEVPTKAGLDVVLKRYITENPILSPEERTKYEFLFKKYDKDKYTAIKKQLENPTAPTQETPATQSAEPPPGFVPQKR